MKQWLIVRVLRPSLEEAEKFGALASTEISFKVVEASSSEEVGNLIDTFEEEGDGWEYDWHPLEQLLEDYVKFM